MISNSASNSILKSSSTSSISNPDPVNTISRHHTRTQTPSSLDGSIENSQIPSHYGKKCYICDRSFILRKKFLCKVCNNYVCSEHFSKERGKEKICDFCERKKAKNEVKQEIENELGILNQELERSKLNCDKVERVYYGKISEINQLGQELAKIIDYHDGKKMLLRARLENEKEKAQEYLTRMENLLRTDEEKELEQQELLKKYSNVQLGLKRADEELIAIRYKNDQVSEKIAPKKPGSTVAYLDIKSKLCQKCDFALQNLIIK